MRAAELMVQEAARLYRGRRGLRSRRLTWRRCWPPTLPGRRTTVVQTHGGFGFAEDFDVERKLRETRLYQVAPMSTNLILSYLAEHVLGLPRSY